MTVLWRILLYHTLLRETILKADQELRRGSKAELRSMMKPVKNK